MQEPDSMVWRKIASNFPAQIQKQKAVVANNEIFVFAEQETQVGMSKMEISNKQWTAIQTIDIPVKADYSSVMVWNNQFYMLAQNQLYTSANGLNWSKVETSETFAQLTACITLENSQKIVGINTENQYVESTDGINWETYETISDEFPTQNLSFAANPLATNDALGRILVMGYNPANKDTANVIWTQLATDQEWTNLAYENNKLLCPNFENPSMIYYNNQLYAFGGPILGLKESKAFSHLYTSMDNGITWKKITELVMFPEEFTQLYQKANGNYSWVIDQDNFLWIMWSETGEVWRGRINKLGFDRK
jgi:hypothetical protein